MMAWVVRQWRRVLWLVKGLVLYAAAFLRLLAHACSHDEPIGIGLLEGAVWAVRGEINAYRIRLVNDTRVPCEAELRLRAESSDAGQLETTLRPTLESHGASELYLVTDWARQFEVVASPPVIDMLRFVDAIPMEGACRLAARLSVQGRLVDELVIVQRFAK